VLQLKGQKIHRGDVKCYVLIPGSELEKFPQPANVRDVVPTGRARGRRLPSDYTEQIRVDLDISSKSDIGVCGRTYVEMTDTATHGFQNFRGIRAVNLPGNHRGAYQAQEQSCTKRRLGGFAENIWHEGSHFVWRRCRAIGVVRQLQQPAEQKVKIEAKLDRRLRADNLPKVRFIEPGSVVVQLTQDASVALRANITNRGDSTFSDRSPSVIEYSAVRRPVVTKEERHQLLSRCFRGLSAVRARPHRTTTKTGSLHRCQRASNRWVGADGTDDGLENLPASRIRSTMYPLI
jgi:hypothetical protein